MAKTRVILIALMAVAMLLASTASAARPCKTLFISSFSISTIPRNPSMINLRSPRYVTVFTEISQFNPNSRDDDIRFDPQQQSWVPSSVSSSAYDFSSLRDRTTDILSVVASLLLGVVCGALTAGIMYFAWSLFSNRSSYNSYSDDGNYYEDIPSPKKMGYVNIPVDDKSNSKPPQQGV